MSTFSGAVDNIALAAAGTAKTVLELAPPASDVEAEVSSWWIEFQGVSASAKPVKVEVMDASGAITGTTVTARRTSGAGTQKSTLKHTATAEGTATTVIESHRIHPQSGIVRDYPLGDGIFVAPGGLVRIRATQDTGETVVNCAVGMRWKE